MQILGRVLQEFWRLSAEMAPYLLVGFLAAALLRAFIDDTFVRRHLGARGWRQTLKAAVIGVPLPLCSCGVIPIAASLRRQGGSAGAVTSFSASTPQTGVDSILATAALLNWPFAFLRVGIAFLNGIVAGTLVDRFGGHSPMPTEAAGACGGQKKEAPGRVSPETAPAAARSCCGTPAPPPSSPSCCGGDAAEAAPATTPSALPATRGARLREGIVFGFVTLPSDIGKALLIGLLLAGAVAAFLGEHSLHTSAWTSGPIAYLATTLVAIPLYVCSTGAIPMAYALIVAGFSPGAALVFLIAGPATNTATVSALWRIIGARSVAIYLGSIITLAWAGGYILDEVGGQMTFRGGHIHHAAETAGWKTLSAVAFYALLAWAFRQSWRKRAGSA
jgi:uncharacterized protein